MSGYDIRSQFPTLGPIASSLAGACRCIARCLGVAVRRTWRYAVAVLLLLAVAHGVATLVLGRKVEAELARLRAEGQPVSAAELAPKPLPDRDNGALIYNRAFKLIRVAYADLRDCDLLSAGNRNDPKVWAGARKAVLGNRQALAVAEQAAAMPGCRFTTNWKAGFGARFPHYGHLVQLANLAAIRAVVQARDGDMTGVARSVTLILRMSYAIKDDATVISTLVRGTIIRDAASAISFAATCGQFSDAQARSLAATLSAIDLGPSFVNGLEGERAMEQTELERIKRNPSYFASTIMGLGQAPLPRRIF